MKHLRLLSMLLLLIVQQALWAGPRTYRQAQAIAEKLAAQMGVSITSEARARSFCGAPATKAGSSKVLTATSTSAYYVFPYGKGQGYAIVSGDDQMPEIVAYSDKGTFEEDNMSEGCRAFLDAYKQVADAVAKGDANALKTIAEKRELMAASNYQQPTVAPLLGDIQWNQSTPYNNMCPVNKDKNQRCYTGCVATAMAQVMRYWQYPDTLMADIPAYTSSTTNGVIYQMPQINKGVKYDWANMLPSYGSNEDSYTQQQADAVATLMLHCGEAVKMCYSIDGSGANIDPEIFVKYFGYDPDMLCNVYREVFSYKEWCKLIDNELIAKRPVLYGGASSSGAHQFVCDGSDGKGFYHINWGWSGNSDGYFDITILSPDGRGIGAGSGTNGYNSSVDMIIGLQPDNKKKDAPLVNVGELTSIGQDRSLSITQADRTSADATFTLVYNAVYGNMQKKAFKGLVNVGIKDAQGRFLPIAESQSIKNLDMGQGVLLSAIDRTHTISYAFPVGTTALYDIYSTDGGKSWQLCNPYKDLEPLEVVATETHLALVNEADNLQATVQTEDDLTNLQKAQFSYTVKNENIHDYFGEIYVYTAYTDELPADPTIIDYVDVEAGGSTTHDFNITPKQPGDLYVWVYNDKYKYMLVDAQKFTVKQNENVKYKLMSKSINVKKDVLERENAFMEGYRVAMPVVDGDEAVVKYELQNNGPTYQGSLPLLVLTYAADGDSQYTYIDKTCTLEGNGAITQLEYRFKASDIGEYPSFLCVLGSDLLGEVDYSSIEDYQLMLVDEPYYYNIEQDNLVGYFDKGSTGIAAAPTVIDGLQVSAGKGTLNILADKTQTVSICNLSGQIVRNLHIQSGTTTTVPLPSGIYVIGKQKIMVR